MRFKRLSNIKKYLNQKTEENPNSKLQSDTF